MSRLDFQDTLELCDRFARESFAAHVGRRWDDVEPALGRHWNEQHRACGSTWREVSLFVRSAWYGAERRAHARMRDVAGELRRGARTREETRHVAHRDIVVRSLAEAPDLAHRKQRMG